MKDINYVEMGSKIKNKRLSLKLTQEQLAEKVNVATSYISEIERGKSICSLAVAVRIAETLDLNLDNLVRGINYSNVDSTFKELLKELPEDKHKLFIHLCTSIVRVLEKDK